MTIEISLCGFLFLFILALNIAMAVFGNKVEIDDIKVEIEKARAIVNFAKTKVPEIDELIDIELNLSQPIQFFTFPVDEGAIYNLTVECLPFNGFAYIFLTDIEGEKKSLG